MLTPTGLVRRMYVFQKSHDSFQKDQGCVRMEVITAEVCSIEHYTPGTLVSQRAFST